MGRDAPRGRRPGNGLSAADQIIIINGVMATIYDAIDRLELLAPDDAENRRAIDVRVTLPIQLTESIHNKIRDYDGNPK